MSKIKEFKYQTEDQYLSRYIDLFSILYIPEESWLRDREKEYFIECIKLNTGGLDLLSRGAKDILENKKGFNSRQYRLLLKNKGWIIQTKSGIQIMPAFDYKGEIPKEISLRFKISYVTAEDRDTN